MRKKHNSKGIPLYSAEKVALKRYGVRWLDSIHTPFGHILSVLVEELGLKKPHVKQMVDKINKQICLGGNGHAQIKDFSQILCYGCKVHYGIMGYINSRRISKERKEHIQERIKDELVGITLEDRTFEGLPENLRLY